MLQTEADVIPGPCVNGTGGDIEGCMRMLLLALDMTTVQGEFDECGTHTYILYTVHYIYGIYNIYPEQFKSSCSGS